MAGLGLANAYGAQASADNLVDLLAARMARQKLAELKAERDEKDRSAREEKTYERERQRKLDERQERLDARQVDVDRQRDEDRLGKQAIDLATLFPGKVVSGETMKRVPKYLHELIAKPREESLARRSINGVAVAGDPHAGGLEFEEHEAIAPGSFELQLPVSERMRLAAERNAAAETKREADERFRQEKLDRDTQHRERMAAIAAQRAAGGGSGGSMGVGADKGELDAVADMVTTNPDLLKSFAPKDRGRILTHIAARRDGGLRNEQAASTRDQIDTALDTIRRLRGDDAKGNKGTGMSGFSGAFGAKGLSSLLGLLESPMAGTDAANAASLFDTLRSQITIPELRKMKGMGALSDAEFKTLAAGASTLNRNLDEEYALEELDRIETALVKARGRLPDARLQDEIVVDDPRVPAGSGGARPTARDVSGGLNGMLRGPSGPRVGAVVSVGGKRVRITKLFPDGTFDGVEVR